MRWISQNWEHYQCQHMVALVGAGVGGRVAASAAGAMQGGAARRESALVQQVEQLYAHE